ncbi:MAG: sigma-70 family RNA polymerase sigma factor [Clostridia bacterium]|nr:sigma-70 family RNA polymerase sigma factor [Clostridia bacterium]
MDQEKIYSEYYPKVLRYVRSKISRYDEAEDLAQNVFVKVFQKWDTFDETKASISTWIYTITHNTVCNYYKSMSYRQTEELPEQVADEITPDFTEEIVQKDMQGRLADALSTMPQEKRDLIILYYYGGVTLKDIAVKMNRPYGQIKRLHEKVLKELSLALG